VSAARYQVAVPTDTTLPWAPTLQHPGSMHRQSVWRERATDGDQPLPLWLRVALLAYSRHRANGHAVFGQSGLTKELDVQSTQLYRAIATAKKYKWIANESTTRCLVVPAYAVSRGIGNPNDRCPIHG
jgi:hypothetical protein